MPKDAELNKTIMFAYEKKKEKIYQWLTNDDKLIFKGLALKDIFLFALALGFKQGSRIPISERRANIRSQYFSEQDEWLLKVVAINEAKTLDVLIDPKQIINIAEEYANGGITHLQTQINNELGDYGSSLHEELHDSLKIKESEIIEKKEVSKENKVEVEKKISVKDYLKIGESDEIEYKSSARWDILQNNVNKELEKVIIKSVSGFLNTLGGTLLIGVNDQGKILGIKKDLDSLKKKNKDSFFQHLTNLFSNKLGLEFSQYWHIDFEEVEGKLVCKILVKPSPKPVFIRDQNDSEFYIRAGPTTRPMNPEESFKYIDNHWPIK